MPTARLISERPQVEFTVDGFRLLSRTLIVDMGVEDAELEDWDWLTRGGGNGDWRVGPTTTGTTQVRVAPGLVYDGASIPPFSLYFMGSRELYEVAAVVHDALYLWQAPRGAADRVFWIIARSGLLKIGAVRGWLSWAALRVFGWAAYRAHRVGGEAQKAVVAVAEKIKDVAALDSPHTLAGGDVALVADARGAATGGDR